MRRNDDELTDEQLAAEDRYWAIHRLATDIYKSALATAILLAKGAPTIGTCAELADFALKAAEAFEDAKVDRKVGP